MLSRLWASTPLASGTGGIVLLDALPNEGTVSLVLKAIITIASLLTTIWSHKKVSRELKQRVDRSDEVKKGSNEK